MPIQSLEQFLFERGLVGSYPIEALKGCTLGIDVNHYISRLLTNKKEQYLDAIGGVPTSLKLYLESDLKVFNEFNITPIFVFNGTGTINQLNDKDYFNACSFAASFTDDNEIVSVTSSAIPSAPASAVSSSTVDISTNLHTPSTTLPSSTVSSSHNHNSNTSTIASHANKHNFKTNAQLTMYQRNKAWNNWNQQLNNNHSYIDQPLKPHEPFRYNNTTLDTKGFQSDLIHYFISNKIMYQVAPFTSWIQLDYLLKSNFIDAIYGPTDCLLLSNIDKFILGMEFPNKDFRFIDRAKILKDFQIDQNEFIDIAMTVGNDLQPSILPPLQIYPVNKLFEIALEMVLNTGTNFYAYQLSNQNSNTSNNGNNNNSSNDYIDCYQRGVSSLKYMPVLLTSGKVDIYLSDGNEATSTASRHSSIADVKKNKSTSPSSPSSSSSSSNPDTVINNIPVPNDIHSFIGQRLPHEYYFYKSMGIATGKLFDAITTGIYPEFPPLDGGFSKSYRNLIIKSVDFFKNKEINLLTQNINRYFQMKPIKQVKWFDSNDKVQLTNRTSPSIFEQLNHIVVKTDNIPNGKTFQISDFIDLINSKKDNLADSFISEKVIFPNSVPIQDKLNSSFDLLSTNFLRFLIQLKFFDFDFTTKLLRPNKWGQIFLKFNDLKIENKFQEKLLILLIFFKFNVLAISEEFSPPQRSSLSEHTLRSYPQESKYILLLTRLLTLFQVDQKPTTIYHGPIDKAILTYREHLNFIKENMNDLYEALLVASLASNEFNTLSLNNAQWQNEIVSQMPFKLNLPNTIMAMMLEFFLQKFLHNGNAKNDALTLVATEFTTFKSVPNLDEQFVQSVNYLSECDKLLTELANSNLIKREDSLLLTKAVEFAKDAIIE